MGEKTKMSFEQALARLEEILGLLNGGEAPLEQSLSLFEEGTALVRFCTKRLDDAERQVKILTGATGESGAPEEKDFLCGQGKDGENHEI